MSIGTAIGIGSAVSGLAGLAGGSSGSRQSRKARREIRIGRDSALNTLNPYYTAGTNALAQYGQGGNTTPIYGAFPGADPLAQYQNQAGAPPEYVNQSGPVPQYQNQAGDVPTFNDRSRFEFNLQEDPIYQYQRDQALQASTRGHNAAGGQLSGGKLNELSRVAAGEAGRYQDAAFRRQLAADDTNYGRSVGEYGLDVDRNRDIYSRGVTDYGLDAARNRDIYGRGVQDYGLAAERNRDIYGRGVTDYGIGFDRDQAQYARDIGEYGLGVGRNQDIYAREQNDLNRLRDLVNMGAQTGTNMANIHTGAGSNIANAWLQNAIAKSNASQYQAESLNNAVQGGLSNYLLADALQQKPQYTNPFGRNP